MKTVKNGVLKTAITAFAPHAVYVKLPNTVEGRVDFSMLPPGQYEVEADVRLREMNSKKQYDIGMEMEMVLVRADVATGHIDFVPVEMVSTYENREKMKTAPVRSNGFSPEEDFHREKKGKTRGRSDNRLRKEIPASKPKGGGFTAKKKGSRPQKKGGR